MVHIFTGLGQTFRRAQFRRQKVVHVKDRTPEHLRHMRGQRAFSAAAAPVDGQQRMAAGGNGFQNALGQQQSGPGVCITPAHHAVVGRILLPVRCAVVYGRAACGAQSPGLPPQGLCVRGSAAARRPPNTPGRQARRRNRRFPFVFPWRAEYAPQKGAAHLTAPRRSNRCGTARCRYPLTQPGRSGALYMCSGTASRAGEPGGPGIFLHQVPSGGSGAGPCAAPEFPLVQQFVIILRLHLRRCAGACPADVPFPVSFRERSFTGISPCSRDALAAAHQYSTRNQEIE